MSCATDRRREAVRIAGHGTSGGQGGEEGEETALVAKISFRFVTN